MLSPPIIGFCLAGGTAVVIDDLIAEGDLVVTRYRWAAIMGIEATGKRVEMSGILIAGIAEGKLAEYRRQEDRLELLRQIGAFSVTAQRVSVVYPPTC